MTYDELYENEKITIEVTRKEARCMLYGLDMGMDTELTRYTKDQIQKLYDKIFLQYMSHGHYRK